MSSKTYFVDLESKRIALPNSRWYETFEGIFPSVTTILSAKSKNGLNTWQINLAKQGIDPKEQSRSAMDEGSTVHDACERLLKGEVLSFYDPETKKENFKLFEEWVPICRFWEAVKELEIEPILIEQTIWHATEEFAGTLDILCRIRPDKKSDKRVFAIIDLKRSASAYVDYHWQISAYMKAFEYMYNSVDERFKDFQEIIKKHILSLEEMKAYLLLLNVDTKKGYRLVEVDNIEQKYNAGFKACNSIWRLENPDLEFVQKVYPLEIGGQQNKIV